MSNTPPKESPLVSILIPARNEEVNIERCVSSLLTQTYSNFEVIVLNDNSEDRTSEILTSLQNSHLNLNIINGSPLPEGWLGKCWACHQLSQSAKGSLFLFTDADTVHESDALKRAVASIQETRSDMLTLVPFQELLSFWERVIVPLVHFTVMCFLPMKLIWTSKWKSFAFANGQFILITREIYSIIGGHKSVKNKIVEDVWLSKAVKAGGGKPMVMNGIDAVRCRMYRSFQEIWEGFSKNLFAGLGYSSFGLVVVCFVNFMCFIFPVLTFALAIFGYDPIEPNHSLLIFSLGQVLFSILMRLIIGMKYHLPQLVAPLHSLSVAMFIGIAFNSMRWIKSGQGALWKGRRYDFSNEK